MSVRDLFLSVSRQQKNIFKKGFPRALDILTEQNGKIFYRLKYMLRETYHCWKIIVRKVFQGNIVCPKHQDAYLNPALQNDPY